MTPAITRESSDTTSTMTADDSSRLRVNASTGAKASALSISATITQSRPSMSSGAYAAIVSPPR